MPTMRALIPLCVALGLAATASAAPPREIDLGVGLGLADPDRGAATWAGGAQLSLVMDDTFVLDLRLLGQGGSGLPGGDALLLGLVSVRYQIDVTRFVPYLRLGAGYGSVIGPSRQGVAVIETGAGLLVRFGGTWEAGAETTLLQGLSGLRKLGVVGRFGVVLGYRWER